MTETKERVMSGVKEADIMNAIIEGSEAGLTNVEVAKKLGLKLANFASRKTGIDKKLKDVTDEDREALKAKGIVIPTALPKLKDGRAGRKRGRTAPLATALKLAELMGDYTPEVEEDEAAE